MAPPARDRRTGGLLGASVSRRVRVTFLALSPGRLSRVRGPHKVEALKGRVAVRTFPGARQGHRKPPPGPGWPLAGRSQNDLETRTGPEGQLPPVSFRSARGSLPLGRQAAEDTAGERRPAHAQTGRRYPSDSHGPRRTLRPLSGHVHRGPLVLIGKAQAVVTVIAWTAASCGNAKPTRIIARTPIRSDEK